MVSYECASWQFWKDNRILSLVELSARPHIEHPRVLISFFFLASIENFTWIRPRFATLNFVRLLKNVGGKKVSLNGISESQWNPVSRCKMHYKREGVRNSSSV
jgi:hypothetical protein